MYRELKLGSKETSLTSGNSGCGILSYCNLNSRGGRTVSRTNRLVRTFSDDG